MEGRKLMSINELIATSSHNAYNSGKMSERSRAIRLATFLAETQESGKGESREIVYLSDLIQYISDESEK